MSIIKNSKHVFIVGIKGVAMAGIARILTQMGKKVDGSDTVEEQITDELLGKLRITNYELSDLIPQDIDLVLYSAAHGGVDSAQVKEAKLRGIQIMSQGAFIAEFLKFFKTSIAICGCHGKTGTSALMAFVLKQLGAKVSWLVGAPYFRGVNSQQLALSEAEGSTVSKKIYLGGHYEEGSDIFVFEADEYGVAPPQDKTPKILLYYPTHIVCTNVDFDHPDIYRDMAHVEETFREFFTHATHVYKLDSHNLEENKQGVLTFLQDLGFKKDTIQQAIDSFQGVARRMEYHGSNNGIDYYDDYGHHPAEIVVTIDSLKRMHKGRRLIVLFQAHTYSRTQALKNEFIESLSKADVVLIDAIFPSAREETSHASLRGSLSRAIVERKQSQNKITSTKLENLAKEKGYSHIKGFENREELVNYAKSIIQPGDVILTLGAGDIYKVISNIRSTN